MNCPNCDGTIKAEDTISSNKINYRHRKCLDCGFDFYTKEEVCPEEEAKHLFTEWSRERSRKARAKKKGLVYEPAFSDGREKPVVPKRPTSPLF